MGSLHERRLYEDGEYGAYQFSFGHFETGLQGWKTIMSYGDEPEYPYFSNPDIRQCRYKPCGVPPQDGESADNATGFGNVAHALAAMESTAFVSDSLIDYRVTESCDTDSGEEGTLRGHGVLNNTQMPTTLRSSHSQSSIKMALRLSTLTGPATLWWLQDATLTLVTVCRIKSPITSVIK